MGIASGLRYLHMDCQDVILHRDIKPANVMLDKNFNVKLADFGLVTQHSHMQTSHGTEIVTGTRSYMDPAYMETGKASGQSDVYSLGVMLLEIVCGKKPVILPGGKNSLIEEVRRCRAGRGENSIVEAADRGLRGQFDEEIKTVLELGLSCVRTDRHNRPDTGQVGYKLVHLAGGLRSMTSIPASASHILRPIEEEYPTDSQGDEESGELPLLNKSGG
jgi:serine/threonine protein kinase